ncbi:WD40 repeat domain-containing protein [Synoicihabitans lomoniglobus]|uniref:WD40 repeat domain-containing protein n=1 Tax=Synoicihabitans lomoniglobus TaxID=2909285 RepID=A0AAE9ZWN0_9BACT|nr:WD40 repeat domain-containing protein [Opitutaceae bacterium LMO-M01]WED65517.1 WD40 repeat domain-containing protein [Opitutaceae bacterium LMO-M01]
MQLTKHWAASLDDYVIDLTWSADGTILAAASADGPVTLFQLSDGAITHEVPGHEDGTNVIAWHPSQPLLATGGQDGAVKLWDTVAGQPTVSVDLGSGWVDHLAWRPDGTAVAAAAGRTLSLLGPDGTTQHTFAPAPKTICAVAWQPAGGCVASAYFGGVVLWDADDYVAQTEFPYANGIHSLVWSPDNRWLVSGNQDPSVHLWLPDEKQEFHMSGYETKVKELSFDHTGRWLATGGGREGCVWDCQGAGPEGREPAMLPHDGRITAVAFQHHHGLLATAAADGAVMLWSPDRRQPLRAKVKLPNPATKLAWSPGDTHLAIGNVQGIVYVLQVQT